MSTLSTINSTDNGTVSLTKVSNNFTALNTDKVETSVIDTDGTLTANSDSKLPSQKAVKTYVDTEISGVSSGASPFYNVKTDYSATGDGVTDDTAAIQEALDDIGSGTDGEGGTLYFPPGIYLCSDTLDLGKQTIIAGSGKRNTIIKFTHTGDGIASTWDINSSTAVYSGAKDISIFCTNGSNVGGGFADVGGTFITLSNVDINAFKYGVIFDQTEVSQILDCNITNNLTAGVWLVNGDEHTVSASTQYTNRISILRCQFNLATGTCGVADDGGTAHTISENNFEGGAIGIHLSGCRNVNIRDNEFENQSTVAIQCYNYSYSGSTNTAGCNVVNVLGNAIYPKTTSLECIDNNSGLDRLIIIGNYFGESTPASVTGCAAIGSVTNYGNMKYGGGSITDA